MKSRSINFLLFATILITILLPMIVALYLLHFSLETCLNLGFNSQIVDILETAAQNLKRLKVTDIVNEGQYHQQFDSIKNLQLVYGNPNLVKNRIEYSLKTYFGFGLMIAVFLAGFIAMVLGRRISKIYDTAFSELIANRERTRYLEEIANWQELAKMVVHEIKNPLTPIEVLITALKKTYKKKPAQDFKTQLHQTETMVLEEIEHLKNIVNRFGELARIPKIELVKGDLLILIPQFIKLLNSTHPNLEFDFVFPSKNSNCNVLVDPTLFRQVISNIVKNGVEANPERKLHFHFELCEMTDQIRLIIRNDGTPVPENISRRLFDPYVSGKSNKENMGLGLAIVKKIIIEHGGSVSYMEQSGHPTFVIALRRMK